MKKILLILLFLSLVIIGGCVKIHPSNGGNLYICEYSSNCKGNVEEGFACSTPRKFDISGDCDITLPETLKDKIEDMRNNPSSFVAQYVAQQGLPKPRVKYLDYPYVSYFVNNKISNVSCSTESSKLKNVFVIGDSLVWCNYVGGVE